MIENSNAKTGGNKANDSDEEEEEAEEELEVDSDGCKTILLRFFTNPDLPYYIIQNGSLSIK